MLLIEEQGIPDFSISSSHQEAGFAVKIGSKMAFKASIFSVRKRLLQKRLSEINSGIYRALQKVSQRLSFPTAITK